MLEITKHLHIPYTDIKLQSIRAQGAGGQNVNKVSTAIHLRFDIKASALPATHKEKLLLLNDTRITRDGMIIIKAQRFSSQEKNKKEALCRLQDLITSAIIVRKKRKPTRSTPGAKARRLDKKVKRGLLKKSRRRVFNDNF